MTSVASTNAAALEASTGIDAQKISKIVDKRVPTEFSEGFFADAVVLVEGDTDRAVIEALANRLGLDLDARGISVIEVSSKESLRIPYEIFSALGIPAYVVVDADFLGADRKHPEDQSLRDGAHETHRLATNAVVEWLPDEHGARGNISYAFGQTSLTSATATIWRDDLEEELGAWPSMVAAMTAEGHTLRHKKNLYAYRNAVLEADLTDLPETLKLAIESIAGFNQPPEA